MATRQQSLAKTILSDPAVESLSSFIGIDGTNNTLNSGRIQINLKAREERNANATEIIRRLQPQLAKIAGITLYMQPVQDLTVEDRVSRTQFQYTLEDPNSSELATYAPQFLERLRGLPELSDVATDQLNQGLRAMLVYNRDTASRLGITPTAIDQTLYDAYGQRQVSTIFTQLNQYHVVLELLPAFQNSPQDLKDLYVHTGVGGNAGGIVAGGSSTTNLSQGPVNSTTNAATRIITGNGTSPASAAFNGSAASSSLSFRVEGRFRCENSLTLICRQHH